MIPTYSFLAFKCHQPIGEFFSAVIPASILRKCSETEPREVRDGASEERRGIQRVINQARLAEIGKYLRTADASFPSSIILSLSTEIDGIVGPAETVVGGMPLYEITVPMVKGVFSVIDGQHRLYSFDDQTEKDFDLPVTIFFDLPREEKAYLFSTINSTQMKVNRSLVYDLFDLAETRSPQKTAHTVAQALNSDETSPFYRRIKLLGVNPRFREELLYRGSISQGMFVDRLLKLISDDPAADRDAARRNNDLLCDESAVEKGLIFRPFFVAQQDPAILKVLTSYFSAVRAVFPDEWQDDSNPLAKSIGFGALMRLLVPLFQKGMKERDVTFIYFEKALAQVRQNYVAQGPELNFGNFPAAGSGETQLYRALLRWSGLDR